jgi:hypothetical protein
MTLYKIEMDAIGDYQVRMTDADGDRWRVVISFPTWRQAQEWIDGRATSQHDTPPER